MTRAAAPGPGERHRLIAGGVHSAVFQERIPGAKGQRHVAIENAGHFLQEDKPDEIADLSCAWMAFVGTPSNAKSAACV